MIKFLRLNNINKSSPSKYVQNVGGVILPPTSKETFIILIKISVN